MDFTEPRYHPLVDADTDSSEMVPLFMTHNRQMVSNSHKSYLSEIVPNYFRLHSSKKVSNKLVLHCPRCGAKLTRISEAYDKETLGLYTCTRCREN